jgi:hypothetical protein
LQFDKLYLLKKTAMAVPYQYDIFISYRRDDQTKAWIAKHFVPLLNHHVFNELGYHPVFYIDDQLESGVSWPFALGHALGTSKVIIPLWSKTYLNSVWCTCEISHMLERESKVGCRTIERPEGLIFPTIIHDGETLPASLSSIQKIEIQECFNVKMSPDSPKAEILADRLKPLGKAIADAILNAPECEADWRIESANAFYNTFYVQQGAQQTVSPKFTNS